jgi:ATPase subunit of ABC transporter with duplicated ATPase domains
VTLENSVAALRNSFEEWTKDIMKELRNLDERISVSSADAQQERDRQPSNAVQTTLQVLESRVDEMGAVVQKVHETTFSTIVEALEDLSILRQTGEEWGSLPAGMRMRVHAPMIRAEDGSILLHHHGLSSDGEALDLLIPVERDGKRMAVLLDPLTM